MISRPKHVTIVILSEEEGKELSVRYAARCILRDVRMLLSALRRHAHGYLNTVQRGRDHAMHVWTRPQDPSL